MQALPLAIVNLWEAIVAYPFAIISLVLFAFGLHRLANKCRCYGLPRNLMFGAAAGALAFVLFELYGFFSRSYGLRSFFLAELLAGYETAVVATVIRRLVFAQRPPKEEAYIDTK